MPWRGSLLPLGGEAAPKRPAHSYRKTAAQPSGSKLPRHGLRLAGRNRNSDGLTQVIQLP
ncbi:hypothetical protein C1C98_31010 [Pseudomonas ogarae]|uniref:DUF1534 domain-containing protein n=1 Tax=Pseudomonas ogarae (strain DSM 112162 / CECT 30235 / F113) TaxID=1114970 RepID=A0ABM6R7V0_PSEO1|nr:hypothetical protein C1C98_31010 [Pseudomonas ogarae]